MPWSHLISFEKIVTIHADAINRYGGGLAAASPRDCIDRSLGAAWAAEMYTATENSIEGLCFAGCLLYYLAMNHCFGDGNKRVAWLAAMHVLNEFGLTVRASNQQAEEYVHSLLDPSCKNTATDVAVWFAERLLPIEEL